MVYQIRDLSANNVAIRHLMRTQTEMYNTQIQVTTGQKSQDYRGISTQSQRLINTENTYNLLSKFKETNVNTTFRLDSLDTTTTTINGSIDAFYKSLRDFQLTGGTDPDAIADIQEESFKTLLDIEGYLNQQIDGRYLYSGTRASSRPVDFNLTSLSDFQARYDGVATTYPTTRDAHLDSLDVSANPATGAANWLRFQQDDGSGVSRITALSDTFSNLTVGATLDISGTPGGTNDGAYTIEAIDAGGTWVQIKTEMLTDEGPSVAPGITLTSADGTVLTNTTDFTNIQFTRASGQITVGTAGALDSATTGLTAGSTFTIAGSTSNNGSWTVVSNDGTNLVVEQSRLTDQGGVGTEVAGSVAVTSYYNGDFNATTARVNRSRSIDFDLNAADPAFEKAIRAMHIVMQGETGKEGGLDQNTGRVDDAMYLLESALGKNPLDTPPYGTEDPAHLDNHLRSIVFNKLIVDRADETLTSTMNYLKTQQEKIENIDQTEAITKLLNISDSLEAAYQSFSRIRELSLVNFF